MEQSMPKTLRNYNMPKHIPKGIHTMPGPAPGSVSPEQRDRMLHREPDRPRTQEERDRMIIRADEIRHPTTGEPKRWTDPEAEMSYEGEQRKPTDIPLTPQQEGLTHPTTGAPGRRTPEGDIVYGPLAETQPESIIPKVDTTSAVTSDEERRRIAAEEADTLRKEQEQIAESDRELAKLQRQKEIQDLREAMGLPSERPVLSTYASDYEALRDEHNVAATETQLNNINREIAEMEAALREGVSRVGDKLAPMELIGSRQQELQRQGREELDALNRRKQVLVDEYNTKQGIIANMMQWKQTDYQNAVRDYEARFNEAVNINSLLQTEKDRERAEELMERDDARANLSVILDTAMKAGQTFEEMPPEMQALARSLELKADYPTGMIDYMMSIKTDPLNDIVSHGKSTDAAGNEFVYMIERHPKTGEMNMVRMYTGGMRSVSGGGGTTDTSVVREGSMGDIWNKSVREGKTVIGAAQDLYDAGFSEGEVNSFLSMNVKELTKGDRSLIMKELTTALPIPSENIVERMLAFEFTPRIARSRTGELNVAKSKTIEKINSIPIGSNLIVAGKEVTITETIKNQLLEAINSIPDTRAEAKRILELKGQLE